jgi:hypothetical protein
VERDGWTGERLPSAGFAGTWSKPLAAGQGLMAQHRDSAWPRREADRAREGKKSPRGWVPCSFPVPACSAPCSTANLGLGKGGAMRQTAIQVEEGGKGEVGLPHLLLWQRGAELEGGVG